MVGDRAGRRRLVGRGPPPVWPAGLGAICWRRPSSWPTGSRRAGLDRAVERASRRSSVLDGDWARTFDPTAGRGVWASGCGCRRWPRRSRDWPRRVRARLHGPLAARAAAYLASRGAPSRSRPGGPPVRLGDPISTIYRGLTSLSHPPNSCGAVALETLDVLGTGRPPPPVAFDAHGVADAAWVHLGLEAARATLARSRPLADRPDAMAPGALERLPRPDRAAQHAARIDPDRVGPLRPSALPRLVAAPPTSSPPTVGPWSASSSPTTAGSAPGWSIRRPASATRTGARSSASTRATPTLWRRASGRCTR